MARSAAPSRREPRRRGRLGPHRRLGRLVDRHRDRHPRPHLGRGDQEVEGGGQHLGVARARHHLGVLEALAAHAPVLHVQHPAQSPSQRAADVGAHEQRTPLDERGVSHLGRQDGRALPDLDEHPLGHLDQPQDHATRPGSGRAGAGRTAVTDRANTRSATATRPGSNFVGRGRIAGTATRAPGGAAATGVARAARAGRTRSPRAPGRTPGARSAAPGTRTRATRGSTGVANGRVLRPATVSALVPAAGPGSDCPGAAQSQRGRQPDRQSSGGKTALPVPGRARRGDGHASSSWGRLGGWDRDRDRC